MKGENMNIRHCWSCGNTLVRNDQRFKGLCDECQTARNELMDAKVIPDDRSHEGPLVFDVKPPKPPEMVTITDGVKPDYSQRSTKEAA